MGNYCTLNTRPRLFARTTPQNDLHPLLHHGFLGWYTESTAKKKAFEPHALGNNTMLTNGTSPAYNLNTSCTEPSTEHKLPCSDIFTTFSLWGANMRIRTTTTTLKRPDRCAFELPSHECHENDDAWVNQEEVRERERH